MVPRKYIFEDADSMSHYLDKSKFNGILLDGVLTLTANPMYPPLKLEMLQVFNEAYYYATRVLFEKFPELDVKHGYLEDCANSIGDEFTRDVIFAMVYIILSRLEFEPDKATRFCNQLQIVYQYKNGYLEEITNVWRKCYNSNIYSDWDWCPPAVDLYELFGTETDWREATDNFNLDNIKSYLEQCVTASGKFEVISDIHTQLFALQKETPDSYPSNLLTNVAMLYSEAKRQKEDEEKKWEEDREAQGPPLNAEILDPEDIPFIDDPDGKAVLEEKNAEIERLNGVIDSTTEQLKEANAMLSEIRPQLEKALTELAELREKDANEPVIAPDDVPGERTLCITTITLVKILRAAGMGHGVGDYDNTKVAELITYFTKQSTDRIRKQVPKTRIPGTAKKEVAKVNKMLKDVNLDISIE